MDKISFTKRLDRAKSAEMTFLPVFIIFTEDYFEVLAELNGDSYFREKYCNEIATYAQLEALPLDEFVAVVGSLPLEERISILYTTLAEPFLHMEQKGQGEKNMRKDGAL